jgi:hypothetical protein
MSKRSDEIRAELEQRGERRREALRIAKEELDAVLKLAPAARKAGITKVDISRLGEVSRPYLDTKLNEKPARGRR